MTQLLNESFTGAPGTPLETYNPVWAKTSSLTGSVQISGTGDRAVLASGNAGYYRSDVVPPSRDYVVAADVYIASTTAGKNVIVTGRASATEQTFYGVRVLTGTGISLVRYTAGAVTVLGTVNYTLTAQATIRVKLAMEGAAISVYINDVLAIGPVNDSSITAAGFVGLRANISSGSQLQVDNLTASLLATAPDDAAGQAQWTEESEAHSAAMVCTVAGPTNWVEQPDSISGTALARVHAQVAWTEGAESASVVAAVGTVNSAAIAWTEGGESPTIAAAASVATMAELAEQSDTHAAAGQIVVRGLPAWVEGSESFAGGLNIAGVQANELGWAEQAEVFALAATSAAQVFARAPTGHGYASRRHEAQTRSIQINGTRPLQSGAGRPPAAQENNR